jgi:hypothetical protein
MMPVKLHGVVMATCFVMQPFDGSTFDKRYADVFKPAIEAADLEPYRVDQDARATVPIEEIENGIRDSKVCFAEITRDNPNVWFELGFAIACGKQVVLVCSDERDTRFPFDIHHRSIITYGTQSTSDFEELKDKITKKLCAYVSKTEDLMAISQLSKIAKFAGLEQHELMALASLGANIDSPSDHASAYLIRQDMDAGGFTRLATALALKTLLDKQFIEEGYFSDYNSDPYCGYSLTSLGWNWIIENRERFIIKRSTSELVSKASASAEVADDIPF